MANAADRIAALRWLVDSGADEAVLAEPRDRFLETKAPPRARPAPADVPPAKATRGAAVPLALEAPDAASESARALAAGCETLDQLRDAMARFDGCDHAVEELTADPDERQPLPVLVGARRLTDEHHAALRIAVAEHEVSRRMPKGAAIEARHRVA